MTMTTINSAAALDRLAAAVSYFALYRPPLDRAAADGLTVQRRREDQITEITLTGGAPGAGDRC